MTYAVLCPGQGAQNAGMLAVAESSSAGRRVLDAAAQMPGGDVRAWVVDGRDLFANAIAQPLICIAQLGAWATLRERLPKPFAFAGYSVGELASYGLADALAPATLARLAHQRAHLMDRAANGNPGGLVAVRGLSRSVVGTCANACEAAIAIANGDDAFVLGAPAGRLGALQDALIARGGQVTCLRVGVASHTALMSAAVDAFRESLATAEWHAPERPVVAGIDASIVVTRERAIATLAAQLDHTIEWAQCLDALHERGCRVFLEMGPGSALSRMVRERFSDIEARSIDEFRDPAAIAAWVERRAT